MNKAQTFSALLIGIISSIFSFFSALLLGDISGLALVIGITPLLLGRLLYGRRFLNYLEYFYTPTLVFQVILQIPAKFYPEAYLNLFSALLGLFLELPERGVIGNLDAALIFEPILGTIIVFGIAYAYREGYPKRLYLSLN